MTMGTLQTALESAFPQLRDRCRKVGHPSKGKADAHLRAMLKRSEKCIDPDSLVVYQCHRCKLWHTGHRREDLR